MASRSSLNHVYRTVWNEALGVMVAVAEISTAGGRRASPGGRVRAHPPALAGLGALSLAIAVGWGGVVPGASANPAGAVAIHGQAKLSSQGNTLTVTTQNGPGSNHSAINWQSFSVPAGSSTRFEQPGANSLSINRVVSNTPSSILGNLSSNGRLVLVNQSGIAVGAGAMVDTAGFTASALRMTDADALAGRLRFGAPQGSAATAPGISVGGTIAASDGDVVLIAPTVNVGPSALLKAANGSTVLAAGQQVEITGRGLEGIRMLVQAPGDQVRNLGQLQGDAVGIFAGTLKHSGSIGATAARTEGGRVVLTATDVLELDGNTAARGAGGKGGTIHATGAKVLVRGGAVVDVSGPLGGGEALVGGGYQGQDLRIHNSEVTVVQPGAQLRADATDTGDGGTVVVWADNATRYQGAISARGGPNGGNGGLAEVSGKQYLDFRGSSDLLAPKGRAGTLLLDPDSLTIGVVADVNGDNTSGDDLVSSPLSVGATGYGSQITAAQVGTLLNTQSVTLTTTTGPIAVNSAITKASGAATTLTLDAGGILNIDAPISGTSGSPLGLSLMSGGAMNVGSALSTFGGSVTMSAGFSLTGAITLGGNVNTGAGNLTMSAHGGISQSAGDITTSTLTASGSLGPVTLNGSNDVAVARLSAGGGAAVAFNNVASSYQLGGNGGGNLTVSGSGMVTVDQALNFNDISITSDNGITLAAGVTSAGGVSLTTSNHLITQTAGAITAIQLDVMAGSGDISLTSHSNSLTLANLTGANVTLKSAGGLIISNLNVGANSNLHLEVGGSLLLPSAPIDTGTGQLSIITGASFSTPGNLFGSNIHLDSPQGVSLDHDVAATGTLQVTSLVGYGGIVQSAGAITSAGAATFNAGSYPVTLTSSGNSFSSINVTGGAVSLVNNGALALGNISADTLSVDTHASNGAITQVGGTSISVASFQASFNAGSGAITLEQPGNALSSVRVVSGGNVRIANGNSNPVDIDSVSAQSLYLSSVGDIYSAGVLSTSTGSIDIRSTTGQINLAPDGAATLLPGSGGTYLSAATGLYVADAFFGGYGGAVLASSSGVLNADRATLSLGGGRWLTYLTNPSAPHVLGPFGAPDFRQVNAPIGTAPTVASGNGNLWSDAAVVSAGLAGTITKVYDGTVDIPMTGASLGTPTGFLFGETPTGVDLSSVVGTLASKNVGTGSVSIPAMALPPVLDTGSVPTYGYQIGATSGNIATVTARPLTINATGAAKIYDGTTNASVTITPAGLVVGESVTVTSTAAFADKNAGPGKPINIDAITLGGPTAGNYSLASTSATTGADIIRANVTISGITAENKVYDGTDTATLVLGGVALNGKIGTDDLALGLGAAGRFNNKNAGVAKPVNVTGISLSGADANNYTLQNPTVTTNATITQASISAISGITATDKTYDGTTSATLVTSAANFVGKFANDSLQVAGGSGAFADRNAGIAKPVDITGLSLGGADALNYKLVSTIAATTATISPASLGISGIAAVDKVYDGSTSATLSAGVATLTGIIGNDQVVVSGNAVGNFSDKNVGAGKTVIFSGLSLDGPDAANYTVANATASGTGAITRLPSVAWTGGAGDRLWSSADNWAGKSTPDGANVAAVSIPAGVGTVAMNSPGVNLDSVTSGSALQQSGNGSFVTTALSLVTQGGLSLGNAANQIGKLTAVNTVSGAIDIRNTGVLEIAGLNNTGGDITVVNTGGVTTTGLVSAVSVSILPPPSVSFTANSPLTIGSAGVVASGDITLTATNLTSAGNLTLDGPVRSDTRVAIVAANNLQQNSAVFGARGVTASAGGAFTLGPQASTDGSPVVYRVAGAQVPPPVALLPPVPEGPAAGSPTQQEATKQVDVIVTFLDRFEKAVENQQSTPDDAGPDERRKRRDKEAITTEEPICR